MRPRGNFSKSAGRRFAGQWLCHKPRWSYTINCDSNSVENFGVRQFLSCSFGNDAERAPQASRSPNHSAQEEEKKMADDNTQGPRTYTVKAGDTLSKISEEFYGDADRHEDIFYANRDKIENPDSIEPGMELTIPDVE